MSGTIPPSDMHYDGAYYPPGISWDMPLQRGTLGDVFDSAVARFSDRPCTNFLGQGMTYGEMGALTEKIAAGLARVGVGPNIHVGLVLPNTP